MLSAAVAGAALSKIATVIQLAMVLASAMRCCWASCAGCCSPWAWPWRPYGALMLLAAKGKAAPPPPSGRAFRLRTALIFAGAFVLVMLLVAWLQRSFGPTWALAGVVVGGFADAHSTAASVGSLAAQGSCRADLALIAIGLIVTTNTLSKLGFRACRRLAPTSGDSRRAWCC